MRDQDSKCQTCRFWRRVRENAVVGGCGSDRGTRSFTRSTDVCDDWTGRAPLRISAGPSIR